MAIGIGSKTESDGFLRLITEDDIIKESIYNILTTRKGERVGNPEFGCDLQALLFNPNIEYYWEAIKLELIDCIEAYEPRVQVLNIEFAQIENSLSVFVVFLKLSTGELDSMAVADITG